MSSKSGSPSPVITRDLRESSVHSIASRSSLASVETNEESSNSDFVRDERYPSPFNKANSMSSLGLGVSDLDL